MKTISRRWPSSHAEQLLAWRIGTNLARALRGQVDLDEDASLYALLEQAEEDGPTVRNRNQIQQEVFAELMRQLPAERPLRVLELNGGTGAATSFVLPVLNAQQTEYVFTDTSPVALKAARQKFREYPFVRYAELAPDVAPLEQEFQASSFDIVICSDAALASHFAPLFAPGALLLLRGDSGRGLASGDGARWYALRVSATQEDARTVLEGAGFHEITDIPDTGLSEGHECAIRLARAPVQPANQVDDDAESAADQGTWWFIANDKDDAAPLIQRLTQSGGRPVLVTPASQFRLVEPGHYELPFGDAAAVLELCKIAGADEIIPRAIVHLGGLNAPTGNDVSIEELRRSQNQGLNTGLAIAQAVTQSDWPRPPRLWMATRCVHSVGLPESQELCLASATTWGLARVLSNEMPHLTCTAIDLGDPSDESEMDSLFRELTSSGDEWEVVLRGSRRYVPRLEAGELPHAASDPDSTFHVAVTTRGSLDSVALLPAQRTAPGPGEVEIAVVASAVNFKDVAKALNMLSEETLAETWSGDTLGLECAGRISAVGEGVTELKVGDRVVALAADCFRPHVVTRAEFAIKVPDHLTLEDAAGIPVVFLTAWYALHQLAHIQAGERVLIHSAAGGVGQAAIQIAHAAGAEVIATAGSSLKRDYLRAQGVAHVFDSRSLSFVDGVRQATNGSGVDVVLNSLAGAAIPASLSLLKPGGRFVEIGKRDIQENVSLGLQPFHNNLSFFALDLDRLLAQRPDMAQKLLDTVLSQFSNGTLTPIPCQLFPVSRASDALRHIAKARQIGKIVLDMRDPMALPQVRKTDFEATHQFSADGTYLVTGGLSGFGLATSKWLVEKGARHLVVLSRRGATSFEAQQDLHELESLGAEVVAMSVDVTNEEQLADALATIRGTLPPLKGVFHAAMVLDDAMALQLTPERMETVLAPKAWGAWNLHRMTLDDPLDHFVLFSSATTIFGNPSQANYVAACTFLDQLAQQRHAAGQPALSVAWGAISDVGYLSRNQDVLKHIEGRLGFKPVRAARMLSFLDKLLATPRSQAALVAVNWPVFSPLKFPIAATPRMAALVQQLAGDNSDSTTSANHFRQLLAAAPPEERRGQLRSFLAKSLASVLGTSPENVETDRSLLTMGLDSLMAVELQLGLSRELEFEISPMQLLRGPTIEELTDELLASLGDSV